MQRQGEREIRKLAAQYNLTVTVTAVDYNFKNNDIIASRISQQQKEEVDHINFLTKETKKQNINQFPSSDNMDDSAPQEAVKQREHKRASDMLGKSKVFAKALGSLQK